MIALIRRIEIQTVVPVIALFTGIASAIMFWWSRGTLWEDEIIAITHGLQPLPLFFIEVLRNDIHPVFYFLLLKVWTSINLGSDSWALASSLVAALFSAVVIAYVSFRVHGPRAALWATALFCIFPPFAWAAGNLRMYGLMPAVAVLCWFANRQYLRTGALRWAIALFCIQLVQTYTHAIGFFFAAFFALAALVETWKSTDRQRLYRWAAIQACSLVTMLPIVASALVRGTEPLPTPDLISLASYPAQLMSVWQQHNYLTVLAIGGATFAFCVLLGIINKASRIAVLVIPCGALLACIAISSMGKPMFKAPVFTANLIPFLAIGAGAGIASLNRSVTKTAISIFLLTLVLIKWLGLYETRIYGNYAPAAAHIVANAQPGDIVIVPHVSVFWGILRYAVGPSWGHPLHVMPLQSNEAWSKLKSRLGPVWVDRIGLNPSTDYVLHNGVKYVIGTSAEHHTGESSRIWIIHRDNYKENVQIARPSLTNNVHWFGGELAVSLLTPDTNGLTQIINPRR